MPTLVLTFPGTVICAECGHPMRQTTYDREKKIAFMECGTYASVFNNSQNCKNYGKVLVLRPVEKMLDDA